MRFETLPLHEFLSRGIESLGFSECTPIQADALPLLLAGRDVAGQAQTGTGKTAAFLLAAMQYLLARGQGRLRAGRPRALIVSPTRELAVQIHSDAQALGRYTGLRLALVYGGVDYEQQRDSLRQPVDILIGTPGRLIDYYRQRIISWQDLSVVVLDEADRMFDLGFIRDVRFLLRRMPPPEQRLSMLFTATLPWRVTELAYEHMNNPELIRIRPDKITVDGVSQQLYHISNEDKMALLVGLLRRINPQRTIIFVNTRRGADRVHGCLQG
ncbi:MAG: DEAD/DEAH box helicase, partial [Gammaproteobacteria bacterium]|nr:DEAD/DEAH box helicase [Gammaproteobacteria bacterium]